MEGKKKKIYEFQLLRKKKVYARLDAQLVTLITFAVWY